MHLPTASHPQSRMFPSELGMEIKVALAAPVLQCKKPRCGECIGHCHHLSVPQVLLRSKSTENLPSHIRRRASCARGEMHPAFLGIMAGKIFLWVQIARHSTER